MMDRVFDPLWLTKVERDRRLRLSQKCRPGPTPRLQERWNLYTTEYGLFLLYLTSITVRDLTLSVSSGDPETSVR